MFTKPLYPSLRAGTGTDKHSLKIRTDTSSETRRMIKNCHCPWWHRACRIQPLGTESCSFYPKTGAPKPSQALSAIECLSLLVPIQLQVFLAVSLDEGPWNQRCHSHGQQLEQCVPGEDGIQRGDLGQNGPCLHTDEIVWCKA